MPIGLKLQTNISMVEFFLLEIYIVSTLNYFSISREHFYLYLTNSKSVKSLFLKLFPENTRSLFVKFHLKSTISWCKLQANHVDGQRENRKRFITLNQKTSVINILL